MGRWEFSKGVRYDWESSKELDKMAGIPERK